MDLLLILDFSTGAHPAIAQPGDLLQQRPVIDQHPFDAYEILMRIDKGGTVGGPFRVKDGDIGPHALAQQAPIDNLL
jgi:hypothetical protein